MTLAAVNEIPNRATSNPVNSFLLAIWNQGRWIPEGTEMGKTQLKPTHIFPTPSYTLVSDGSSDNSFDVN